ncbi:hypothetical protein C7U89_25335 [Bradyrhizobium sp. WBOS4]|nr:hypothetical protein [Bradyrhizobium sp. WBOS8]MDD1586233.1 hypothetical protein [Bradyrhizobium sp. WBOS4]UUO47035.1 hypothetical protein DCM78_08965 [Bradyrhizobium sp. WBOS04]UUO60652.1 hypothetical protein DCM80_16705 [Bradyrhizobium sp. WBOS08]
MRPTKISASGPPSTWWPGERCDKRVDRIGTVGVMMQPQLHMTFGWRHKIIKQQGSWYRYRRIIEHFEEVAFYDRVLLVSATTITIATAAPIAQTPSALILAPQRLTRSLSDMTQLSI